MGHAAVEQCAAATPARTAEAQACALGAMPPPAVPFRTSSSSWSAVIFAIVLDASAGSLRIPSTSLRTTASQRPRMRRGRLPRCPR